MMEMDIAGRRRDCHFCVMGTKRVYCSALKDFYNADNSVKDLCGDCPFYKTDREFREGWNSGRTV